MVKWQVRSWGLYAFEGKISYFDLFGSSLLIQAVLIACLNFSAWKDFLKLFDSILSLNINISNWYSETVLSHKE